MEQDYAGLGFRAGLEIHQQISGLKLFCSCQAIVNDENKPTVFFQRKLRAAAGELGAVDAAAQFEMRKDKTYSYDACLTSSCLVEYDEEPSHHVNHDALILALEVAQLLHATVIDEVQFMRKTVVDGSNTSAFQRTAVIGLDGFIETSKGRVCIPTICLEEEAAKKIEEKEQGVRYRLDRLGVALIEIATDDSIKDPDHAKEVAGIIGMILRSTGKVKRGIGSIRQDVNVSIKGHPRVEIKGFQELDDMPKVISYEIQRQSEDKNGVAHVRKANQDGTTTYLRPMPGAARMYPETDIPSVRITPKMFSLIKLPELLDQKIIRLEKQYKIPADLARSIVREEVPFESYAKKFKSIEPSVLGHILIDVPKEIQKRYNLDPEKISTDKIEQVCSLLNDKKITREAVLEIYISLLEGKGLQLEKYKAITDKELEKILRGIIVKNPGAPVNALMGEAMAVLRGKVEGQKIMTFLKKLI